MTRIVEINPSFVPTYSLPIKSFPHLFSSPPSSPLLQPFLKGLMDAPSLESWMRVSVEKKLIKVHPSHPSAIVSIWDGHFYQGQTVPLPVSIWAIYRWLWTFISRHICFYHRPRLRQTFVKGKKRKKEKIKRKDKKMEKKGGKNKGRM